MTEGSVSDIIVARAQMSEPLNAMIPWAVAAHMALFAFMVFMPASWRGAMDEGPRTVMTISLGGAPGPRNGGLTTMGGRTVLAPPPEPVKKVVETPPAAKTPEMVLPAKNPRIVKQQPKEAPKEATARTPATGQPQEGSTRVDTGARGQGFGLTSSGGGGTGVTVDTTNFCCPEYLSQMVTLIQRNWDSKQPAAGSVVMKFTITRAGTIENVQLEQASGFVAHEYTAQRALLLTRLPELPIQYPNSTLTVHMRFEYQR
jgi:outer membrane biosynthesis protein TonB